MKGHKRVKQSKVSTEYGIYGSNVQCDAYHYLLRRVLFIMRDIYFIQMVSIEKASSKLTSLSGEVQQPVLLLI